MSRAAGNRRRAVCHLRGDEDAFAPREFAQSATAGATSDSDPTRITVTQAVRPSPGTRPATPGSDPRQHAGANRRLEHRPDDPGVVFLFPNSGQLALGPLAGPTARTFSKISCPISSRVIPVEKPSPALMSKSFLIRVRVEFVAILTEGAGRSQRRPAARGEHDDVAPPATCPVTETGS
jgi:hypothetical protein